MKKLFLNKKLMTFVLSFCLVAVIGGIAVFAAFQSGLPGIDRIMENIDLPQSSEDSPKEDEPVDDSEQNSIDLNDVTINPAEPENTVLPEEPEPENTVVGPIVFRAPERMMAITLAAGVDYYTEEGMSTEDIQKSIDKAIEDAKKLSANTVFLETSFGETVLYSSAEMPQAKVSIDILGYAAKKAKEADLYVYVVFDVLKTNIGGKAETSFVVDSDQLSVISANAKALSTYDIDGIMLNTYTVESDGNAYADYVKYGSGMGYENYLRANVEAAVATAYKAVKAENPAIAVGIAVDVSFSSTLYISNTDPSIGTSSIIL